MKPVKTLSLDGNNTHLLYTDQKYHYFPKHYHETYSVAMLSGGAKNFATAHEKGVLDRSNLAVMNPGEVHSGTSLTEEGWNQLVILFDIKTADKFIAENELNTKELVFGGAIKNDTEYRQELEKIYSGILHADCDMEREQSFQSLLGLLFAKESERSVQKLYANPYGIKKAIEQMNALSSEKLTLDELASNANMSKFHFIRSFREATGITPHAYLNILRIERARRMIFTTDTTIADIATECGFADQAHFTRAYKKIYGTPPSCIVRK
ncbi:MAG: helix-turn-helix domain-containing protein [Deferribacterales bacterium]